MKVSVQILTYNHGPFIAKALDSVLAQQAHYPFEVVVGDDGSTDGTRAVLREYARRHPNIRLLLHERNLGSKANYKAVTAACRGQYIAFLDGDDWWAATTKLQLQSDYLDAHTDCPLVCHYATFSESDAASWPDASRGWIRLGADRLLLRSPATTSTCMVRACDLGCISDIPPVLLGDKARAVALAHRVAPIACLPLALTVRRVSQQGVLGHVRFLPSQQRRERSHRLRIEFLEEMDRYTGHAYQRVVSRPLARLYYAAALQNLLQRDWRAGWFALRNGWRNLNQLPQTSSQFRAGVSSLRLFGEIFVHQVRHRTNS